MGGAPQSFDWLSERCKSKKELDDLCGWVDILGVLLGGGGEGRVRVSNKERIPFFVLMLIHQLSSWDP